MTSVVNNLRSASRSFFFLFLFTSCFKSGPALHSLTGKTMGTYYSVKIFSEPIENKEQLQKEIDQYLQYINSIYSTYEESSELSLINKFRSPEGITISDELAGLLKESLEINKETMGYFDITIGPIVNLWGFGPQGELKEPEKEIIESYRSYIGIDKFLLKEGRLFKKHPKLYIDLSAIAKGRGVDMLYNLLVAKGFKDILVEIGGEIRAKGFKNSNQKWKVGLEKPVEQLGQSIQTIIELSDISLATSGSYRNYKKIKSENYSHTINPVTLRPTNHNLVSISVLDKNCSRADAIATALMAMGEEKAYKFAKENNINGYFIIHSNDKYITKITGEFQKYILKKED